MSTKLTYQNYGTSILIFVEGNSKEAAYGKWLSLFNWGATATGPDYVTDQIISCWSDFNRFTKYLFNLHLNRILNNKPANMVGCMDDAVQAYKNSKSEFEATTHESYRSINQRIELPYEFGIICAEKPDEDFSDAVVNYAFGK